MRVLIVSQYFAPEITAASLRLEPIAAGLAERGHDVEVLCEAPNHPHGVVPVEFRRRLVTRRETGGYRVSHVWVKASESKRARARVASYASFATSALVVGSAMKRPDVVISSSPPLSVGAVGAVLARRHRVPAVFDVRDLWPEIAVALGEIGPGRLLAAVEGLEQRLYRDAAAITTPTEPFQRHISAIAGSEEKVHVLFNGTTREWLEAGVREPDRTAAGIDSDRFVWTYAGNLGLSQNLDVAIEAAGILGDGFQLLLLGDGTARRGLEERAGSLAGREVIFRAAVPPQEAQGVMRASDALVVLLADVSALEKTIPVKLYDSCAIGRPVIVSAQGEARRLAEEAGAAITLDPGDASALAKTIRELRDDEALRDRLTGGGRRFAEANVRDAGVERLEQILEALPGVPTGSDR